MRRPVSVNRKCCSRPLGGCTRGALPLLWGEPVAGRVPAWFAGLATCSGVGGTRPPPLAPFGGNGKGGINKEIPMPCCRRLILPGSTLCRSQPPTRPASIRTLLWSIAPVASWGPQCFSGCCHLSVELSLSFQRARSATTAQSPEHGDLRLLEKTRLRCFPLGCSVPCFAIPQWLVDFAGHP